MDHPYYISPSKQQRNIVQLCTRLIWTMDFCSRWPGRSNMYISCTFTPYRPSGFQLSIKNSSTFERVRVFGLMTARDSDNSMILVIAFTNSCSFLFLYVFIPLVPFLFLVSALPHGRRHRQTTLVTLESSNGWSARIQKKTWTHFIQPCFEFSVMHHQDNRRRKGIYFSEIIIRTASGRAPAPRRHARYTFSREAGGVVARPRVAVRPWWKFLQLLPQYICLL